MFTELGRFNNSLDLELLLSIFRSKEIKYYKKGTVNSIFGIEIGGLGETTIFIKEDQIELAKKIVEIWRKK